jgi:hypothetical protein
MRKTPSGLRNRPCFSHDENLEFLQLRKKCNKFARFESIVMIMKKQGAKDPEIIKECNKKDYHVITHNTQDFQNISKKTKIGIICVGLKKESDWIPKMNKLLNKLSKHKDYYYKNILISNNITIKNRLTGSVRIY